MGEKSAKPLALGINHVALDVRDIDVGLEFVDQLFQFELRGRGDVLGRLDILVNNAAEQHPRAAL